MELLYYPILCGLVTLLALFVFGPIFLLLKRVSLDGEEFKKRWGTYTLLFLAGALSPIVVLPLELLTTRVLDPDPSAVGGCFLEAFFVAAFVEESVKYAILAVFALRSKRFTRYARCLAFAAFISLGFAFVENVLYVFTTGGDSLETAFLRALAAIPGHFIDSIFMGYFFALAILGKTKGVNILRTPNGFADASDQRKKNFWKYLALSYLAPFAAHGVYDFLLMALNTEAEWVGMGLVLWLGLLIGGFKLALYCCDEFKAKDAKIQEKEKRERDERNGIRYYY